VTSTAATAAFAASNRASRASDSGLAACVAEANSSTSVRQPQGFATIVITLLTPSATSRSDGATVAIVDRRADACRARWGTPAGGRRATAWDPMGGSSGWDAPAQLRTDAPSAAARMIASIECSTSSEVVAQFETEMRIAAIPCQVVPLNQHVPSS